MNWPIRRQVAMGLVTSLFLFVFLVLWGVLGSLSGAVIVKGEVQPQGDIGIVQHAQGGTLARILVRNGDQVSQGQVLVELEGGTVRADLAIARTQLAALAIEKARLVAEAADRVELQVPDGLAQAARADPASQGALADAVALLEARHAAFRQVRQGMAAQTVQIRSEITALQDQLSALRRQRDLVTADLARLAPLRRDKLVPSQRILEREREGAAIDAQISGNLSAIAGDRARIAGLDAELAKLTAERQSEIMTRLNEVQVNLDETSARATDLARQVARLQITAPLAGTVHALAVTSLGAVIQPAEPILYIVPRDEPMLVTARIDPAQIALVHEGQIASVRLTAFDARLTPELEGRVQRLSADVEQDRRSGAAYYSAEIALAPDDLVKLGNRSLVPGMPAEVHLQTPARSPLGYLLRPIIDFLSRTSAA